MWSCNCNAQQLPVFLLRYLDESPKPRLIKEPSNQLAIKGTNVTLECTAISSVAEPMFFQWRRDNIDIKSNETETKIQELNNNTIMTSFFHLNDVNREHNGKYQCTVTNSFGSAYSQRFKITVASMCFDFTLSPLSNPSILLQNNFYYFK